MKLRTVRVGLVLALVVAVALSAPVAAQALTLRTDDIITIGSGETINDDVYAFGSSITIDGTVNGDVITAGQTITITGNVTGGVFAAGQTVRISGDVGGSVRAAGAEVTVEGPVGGDVLASGNAVVVGAESSVGRDVALAGARVKIGGSVGRNALVSAQDTMVESSIGGNLQVAGDTIDLAQGTTVGGDFEYWSDAQPTVAGEVSGQTIPHAAQRAAEPSAGARVVGAAFGWVRGLIGWALFGLLALLLLPKVFAGAAERGLASPWPSLGIGAAVMFVTPVVAAFVFVIGLLIGGWWIAFILLAIWWVLLAAGFIAGVYTAGMLLARRMAKPPAPIAVMLVGLLIVMVIGIVPLIGWLAGLAAMLIGTGSLVAVAYHAVRPKPMQAEAMPQVAPPMTPPAAPPMQPPMQPPSAPPMQPPSAPPVAPPMPPESTPPVL